MRSTHALSIVTLVTLLAAACSGEVETPATTGGAAGGGKAATAAAPPGETLATVNGVSVTVEEFQEAAARKSPAQGDELSADEKQEVLDRLVAEKLLYKQALDKGLDQDPKVQKVMVNTLLREDVYANVRNSDFTDEELEAFYEANKDDFIVPEKVQIKRILVKINDERSEAEAKAEIDRIHAALKQDAGQFKDLAGKHSEDPYRRRGGDVGFVARTGKPGLDPEVVETAFGLEVDQLSAPFKTAEGYNVVLVANKRERVERTFQQMKGTVLRKVKNDKLKELYESYVASLRSGADVQINQDKLAAVEVSTSRKPIGPGFALTPPDEGGADPGEADLGAPDGEDGH